MAETVISLTEEQKDSLFASMVKDVSAIDSYSRNCTSEPFRWSVNFRFMGYDEGMEGVPQTILVGLGKKQGEYILSVNPYTTCILEKIDMDFLIAHEYGHIKACDNLCMRHLDDSLYEAFSRKTSETRKLIQTQSEEERKQRTTSTEQKLITASVQRLIETKADIYGGHVVRQINKQYQFHALYGISSFQSFGEKGTFSMMNEYAMEQRSSYVDTNIIEGIPYPSVQRRVSVLEKTFKDGNSVNTWMQFSSTECSMPYDELYRHIYHMYTGTGEIWSGNRRTSLLGVIKASEQVVNHVYNQNEINHRVFIEKCLAGEVQISELAAKTIEMRRQTARLKKIRLHASHKETKEFIYSCIRLQKQAGRICNDLENLLVIGHISTKDEDLIRTCKDVGIVKIPYRSLPFSIDRHDISANACRTMFQPENIKRPQGTGKPDGM
jgi:hypothetical protein